MAKNGVSAMDRTEPALKQPYKMDIARPRISGGTHLHSMRLLLMAALGCYIKSQPCMAAHL